MIDEGELKRFASALEASADYRYYTGRKSERWNKVPTPLVHTGDDDKIRAMRNLRRYIQKAEKVVLNVARGQFPGEY